MLRKLTAIIVCAACLFSFVSCTGKESEQNTAVSSEPITETETAEKITEETSAETETEKAEKIYLDATDKDLDELIKFYLDISIFHFWNKGFDSKSSDFSYDIPAIYTLIYSLYGSQDDYVDAPNEIPQYFHGVITYFNLFTDSTREMAFKENRKVFDPLFRFSMDRNDEWDMEWYEHCFFSIDAKTVEWVETELFGGTPDRENLINNEDAQISCYYCDGRYYFKDVGGRGGGGVDFKITDSKRDSEGKYLLTITEYGYDDNGNLLKEGYAADKSTAGLIEKDGERFWKIFSIDWDKNSFC